MKRFIFIFSIVVGLSQANASEMVGALSAGMGGTGRAAVQPNESVYLNPASIALVRGFHSGFSYQNGFLAKDIRRNTYSLVLTDATKGIMFPGSLAYRRHSINQQGLNYSEDEFRLAFGYRVTDRISLGAGFGHFRGKGPDGRAHNDTNFDFGSLFGLTPQWGLSVTGENLLEQSDATPEAFLRPSRVALGTQYLLGRIMSLRYEALMPLYVENTELLGHRFGASVQLRGQFQLNGGFSVDDFLEQNWSSVGLAWMGPRLKLAYSLQSESRSGLGSRHLVDLWLDI